MDRARPSPAWPINYGLPQLVHSRSHHWTMCEAVSTLSRPDPRRPGGKVRTNLASPSAQTEPSPVRHYPGDEIGPPSSITSGSLMAGPGPLHLGGAAPTLAIRPRCSLGPVTGAFPVDSGSLPGAAWRPCEQSTETRVYLRLQWPVLHQLSIHREQATGRERLQTEGTGRGIADLWAAQVEMAPVLHGQE